MYKCVAKIKSKFNFIYTVFEGCFVTTTRLPQNVPYMQPCSAVQCGTFKGSNLVPKYPFLYCTY